MTVWLSDDLMGWNDGNQIPGTHSQEQGKQKGLELVPYRFRHSRSFFAGISELLSACPPRSPDPASHIEITTVSCTASVCTAPTMDIILEINITIMV